MKKKLNELAKLYYEEGYDTIYNYKGFQAAAMELLAAAAEEGKIDEYESLVTHTAENSGDIIFCWGEGHKLCLVTYQWFQEN